MGRNIAQNRAFLAILLNRTREFLLSFLGLFSRFFALLIISYRSFIGLYRAFFRDYKRVIAYSTSSQLCLIRTFFVLRRFFWGLFYVYIHAFFKASLFVLTRIIIHHNESQLLKFFNNTIFWGLFIFCLYSMIRIPFLSVARIKDDLLLSSSRFLTLFLIFFALSTIFYSLKLASLSRYIYLNIFFGRRLFFGCFLVFFRVFFDLNLAYNLFFDDFLIVFSLLFLGFSVTFFKSIVFCYDIFWKFFGIFRFYLREFELSIFWGFFVLLFFVL